MPYIPVAQRGTTNEDVTGRYVSVAQRFSAEPTKPTISPFQQDVFAGDQALIPLTPPKSHPLFKPERAEKIKKFGVEVAQSILRNIRSVGITLLKPLRLDKGLELDAADKFTQAIYGDILLPEITELTGETRAEQIRPLSERRPDIEKKIRGKGKEWEEISKLETLTSLEKKITKRWSKFLNRDPGALSFVFLAAYTGIDLTPWGGSTKGAFKAIKEVSNIGDALILGRKMGVEDDLLSRFAKDAVGVKTTKEAENLFKGITDLQQTTRVAPRYTPVAKRNPLFQEARKYKSAEEFANKAPSKVIDELRNQGVRGAEQRMAFWEKATKGMDKTPIIDSLNPTGGLLVDYTPQARMTAKLADNITTLDKTMGKFPDEMITIYRGAPKNQKSIVGGDFVTTNPELARSYTGDGNVLSKKVKLSDVLDDIDEPLGEEYLYRPKSQLTDIWKQATDTGGIPGVRGLKKVGLAPIPTKKITRGEDILLKQKLRTEARGAKTGIAQFKREKKLLDSIQKQISKELNKPKVKQRSTISFIKQLGEMKQGAITDAKKSIGIQKPITRMNLEELNTLTKELKDRLAFKRTKGFEPGRETIEKLNLKPKTSKAPEFTEDFYAKNLEVKQIKTPIKVKLKEIPKNVGEFMDKIGGSISTRLENISPILKSRIRKYEFDTRRVIKKDIEVADPMIKGFSKLSKEDYWRFDLALKNGDTKTINSIVEKYGIQKEYDNIKKVLDDMWNRADEVGFDIGYRKNYWPRQVKDTKGFLEHLQGTEAWSALEEAIKRKELDLGRHLTEVERAGLINTMLRGYRNGGITLSKTGAMENRVLDAVTPELNKFYANSDEALLNYIERTNDAIESRKFFGKQRALQGAPKEALNNLEDSIGTFTSDLLTKGEITPKQELELRSILEARFNPGKTGIVMGVYKNLAYIDTLGSVVNAITQIGDMAFAMYKGGWVRGLKEGAKSFIGKAKVTKQDVGFATREISAEMERRGLGAFLDRLFRITGFNKIDKMGAESLINASIRKAQRLAIKDSDKLHKELTKIFPKELFGKDTVGNVIRDLKNGFISDDVKYYAFNNVLDFSPRALSEMPEQYLRSGNGRVFYVLKTWTLKLFDVYRNEIFRVAKENKVQALKNMIELGVLLFTMNATADEIKDFIRGRKTEFSDLVVNNLAKLVGFSRYHTDQVAKEGLAATLGSELVPPFPAVDNISKDIIGLFKDFDKATELSNIRTIREIPVGGELFYYWFGPGKKYKNKDTGQGFGGDLPELPKIPQLPDLPKLP